MRHTEFALRRPVTTMMVFVALAVVGVISSRLLALEEFPDIQWPGIFIQVPYPGSTPEEVERRITRPIEEALATLSGVERMHSISRSDDTEIQLFFGWDQDAQAKGIEARAKIDAIRHQLPDDVQRVLIFTASIGDTPILNLRISSDRDLSDAYDMLDRSLKRRIERVEGVSRVELYGVDPREIRILLDADKVAGHNIDINDLRMRLEKSNFAVSAGKITEGGQRLSVRPTGEFRSLEEIENVIVDEGSLRVRDIAMVTMRSPERNYGRHLDRSYAVGVDVYKATGANMVEVVDRVMTEIEAARQLPQMRGINIFNLQDRADAVRKSLADLLQSGIIGAILAILVLYAFLRQIPTTLIVTLSVPFSLLITLGAMYFFGLTLNVLTMMGLMLAVGMLVDNAVVITESIFRYRQKDDRDPEQATLGGVRDVGLAVIAGTMTSIIVFIPIMFGVKADVTVFLTHVAITISVAMLASLLIAQTLIPMLAARLPSPPPVSSAGWITRLATRYSRTLAWTLQHPWWTALGVIVILGTGAIPPALVHFEAFPQETSRRLFLEYYIEGTHPLEVVEASVDRVEEFLFSNREELDIRSVYSYYDPSRAQSTILLTEEDQASVATRDVIAQIVDGLPEIIIGEPSFSFDRQGGTEGFSLQLAGDSSERLSELSIELVRVLRQVEGLDTLRTEANAGEPEIWVTVDRERARQVGLSTEEIAATVATAMRGENLRQFRGDTGEIAVRLAYRDTDKQSVEQLADLPLYTQSGRRVPLGAVADFEFQKGPQSIEREDRQTAVVITGNLAGDTSLDDLKPKIERVMEQFNLPPGYSWKFGRGFEQADETQQIMMQNILLGIVLIFIVMAALFESTLYPLSIITSILFSVIGVFWFFLITGTTFSFMASIGIMILIGVVVNNGIVLVDHINNLRRTGMKRNDAVVQAGRDRLRPILMTVATTILGLTPLAIGTTELGSTGAPYFPMARAIIGGLAFSTIVSLLVVPSIYVWLDGLNRWGRKVLRTARAPVRTLKA